MKTIILIISLFLIVSCSNSDEVVLTKEEYNELIKYKPVKPVKPEWPITINPLYCSCKATLITIKGHQILFTANSKYGGIATMHWPECTKCLKDSIKVK